MITQITQYAVRVSNSYGSFTSTFDNLHDAEVSFNTIMEVNKYLVSDNIANDYHYIFFAWLDKLTVNVLDDGTKITQSSENIRKKDSF